MQALYILRGCLAAYAAGVIVISAGSMVVEGGDVGTFGVIAIFGLFALVPVLIIAFVIWAILAARRARILMWQAMALCAATFFGLSALAALAGGEILAILAVSGASPLVGAAFGAVFWLGAFGARREMVMGTRMPEDWWGC